MPLCMINTYVNYTNSDFVLIVNAQFQYLFIGKMKNRIFCLLIFLLVVGQLNLFNFIVEYENLQAYKIKCILR